MNNDSKRNFIFQKLLRANLDIIALQEVHCNSERAALWKQEWPGQSWWGPGGVNTAGVALLFHPRITPKLTDFYGDFNGRSIAITVDIYGLKFRLINIYAPNTEFRGECEQFFDETRNITKSDMPQIILGDFNMVENTHLDRKGGNPREKHTWGLTSLNVLKKETDSIDIWRHLYPKSKIFTWHSLYENVHSRLDRIYISKDLIPFVNGVEISNFSISDHDIVAMNIDPPSPPASRGPGYWKINNSLLEDKEYQKTIKDFWISWQKKKGDYPSLLLWWDLGKYHLKETTISYAVRKKYKENRNKNNLEKVLNDLRNQEPQDFKHIAEIRDQLREIEIQKAKKIFIATQMDELEKEEKPTKFFYNKLKAKQNRQRFSEVRVPLEKGGYKISNDIFDVLKISTSFYEQLYSTEKSLQLNDQISLIELIDKQLEFGQHAQLDADITKQELREALADTQPGKSPGWDGLSYDFYKTFWPLLEDDFIELQNCILNVEKSLTKSQQRALISLLYKDGDKRDIKNWRPISLLCTDYKLITKVIANRIKRVLPSIIHQDQTCTIPGRSIYDNLSLTRDIISYTKMKEIPGYMITIDQEKAFDRVDRNLLFKILKRFNFSEKMLAWLKILYEKPQSALYINGFIGKIFVTERGIRQGCPLSAILYIIYAEALGNLIRKDEKIHGIPLPGKGEDLKISQYADDTTLYIHIRTNICYLFDLLAKYEKLSGSKVKISKTKGLCLGPSNPPKNENRIIWQEREGLEILGVSFFTDFIHTLNFNWLKQYNNLTNYLDQNSDRDLSFKGKVIQLNTIALAPYWFTGTILPLPTKTAKTLVRRIMAYLWGQGKQATIKFDTLLSSRTKGGLGLSNPMHKAFALRIKMLRPITDPSNNQNWIRLARYFIGSQLATLNPEWKFLKANSLPHLDPSKKPPWYYLDVLRELKKINHPENFQWTVPCIYLKINELSTPDPAASRTWPQLRNYVYNWNLIFGNIFNTYAPGKFQELHYKFVHLALPTRELVAKMGHLGKTDINCTYCKRKGQLNCENHPHLFFSCESAYEIWEGVRSTFSKFLPKGDVHFLQLALGVKTPQLTIANYKIVLTLLQICLKTIWENSNKSEFDSSEVDLRCTLPKIFNTFYKIIRVQFRKANQTNSLAKFRTTFCQGNSLITIDNGLRVDVPIM